FIDEPSDSTGGCSLSGKLQRKSCDDSGKECRTFGNCGKEPAPSAMLFVRIHAAASICENGRSGRGVGWSGFLMFWRVRVYDRAGLQNERSCAVIDRAYIA